MKLSDFINEDSNQFGPGTDLMISLLAVLMVICLMLGYLYSAQRKATQVATKDYNELKQINEELTRLLKEKSEPETTGNFKLSSVEFNAALFKLNPVDEFEDEILVRTMVANISKEYKTSQSEFPFIFIIGHSNVIDDPNAIDKSDAAKFQRNWNYAGRRAAVIARLLEEQLPGQKDNIVVVSTGEFDLRNPDDPKSQDNAWVQVKFGKEWK